MVEDQALIKSWHGALVLRRYGDPDSPGRQYIQSLANPGLVRINANEFFEWKFG